MYKKGLNILVGILISIFLLYIVFRKIPLAQVVNYIISAQKIYVIAALVLGLLLLLLRSYRWKLMVEEYKNFGILNFFESTVLGLFFNTVLPFRVGDIIQGVMISKKTNIAKSTTLATVVMERFVDLFPPIIFIIIGSFFITLPKEISIVLSIVVLSTLVLCLIFLRKVGPYVINWVENLKFTSGVIGKIVNFLKNFFLVVINMKMSTMLFKVMPLTLILWSGYSIGMFLICLALGIKLPSIFAGFLIQAITALSVTIPSSPGYVGTWEFMSIIALSIFKVDRTKSVSFGLLSHILGMIPVVVFGVVYVIKEANLIKNVTKENKSVISL